MKLIFKLFAAPVVVTLTLATAIVRFLLAASGAVLGFVSVALLLLSIYTAFRINMTHGLICAAFAFAISPLGLPKLVEWIADRLDGLNYALRDFITG